MVVVDFRLDPEAARVRPDFAEGFAHCNLHGLQHADVAPGTIERFDANQVDGGDERSRAAVHDRRFRSVDLDHGVVDAQSAQRRQHMFGGGDERSGFIAQDGREFGRRHRIHVGGDLALAKCAAGLCADEPKTGVGIGRMKRQRDGQARMNADPA